MKHLYPIFIGLIFISCSGKVKHTTAEKDSAAVPPPTTYPSVYDSSFYDQDHTVKSDTFSSAPWTCKTISYPSYDSTFFLNAPFNSVKALKRLFPGNAFESGEDGLDNYLMDWSSNRRVKFETNEIGVFTEFPFKEGNETRIKDTSYYILQGKEYILISFTTRVFSLDELRTGRFEGAVLGLALFEKQNQRWQLTAFNPAIIYNGAFQTACSAEPVLISAHEMAYKCVPVNGGAGGPFSGPLQMITKETNTFSLRLTIPDIRMSYSEEFYWKETITPQNEGQILIVLNGVYNTYSIEDWAAEFTPAIIKEMGKQDSPIKFTYTYVYKREDKRFVLVKKYYKFK